MKIIGRAIFGGIGIWVLMFVFLAFLAMLFNNLFDIIRAFSSAETIYPTAINFFIHLTRFFAFVFTGFMTARFAKRNELLHGLCIGFVVWAIMAVFIIIITDSIPGRDNPHSNLTEWTLSTISLILGCLMGAFIQKRIKQKKEIKDSIETKIDKLGEATD